jgi:hypothetical protein
VEEETVVELNREIRAFWLIVATAAYFQKEVFPNWVTPDTPRQEVEPGRSSWMYAHVPLDELRRQYLAVSNSDDPPASFRMNEIEVHMDQHRYSIEDRCAYLGAIEGTWDIGLGFLYLGPPDPEVEDRQGFGIVYWWVREWEPSQSFRVVYDEAAAISDRVYRTLGRDEVKHDRSS